MQEETTRKLNVLRILSTGETVPVGTLSENRSGVYCQHSTDYVANYPPLSPIKLDNSAALQQIMLGYNQQFFGVFSDSLPDGWGLLLQDKLFTEHGFDIAKITVLDRLALVGNRGIGALIYQPQSTFYDTDITEQTIQEMAAESEKIRTKHASPLLPELLYSGSSGGARPKVQVYSNLAQPKKFSLFYQPGDVGWIIKFSSPSFLLGYHEGLVEASYLTLADQAALAPVEWQLIPTEQADWLAVRRFDMAIGGSNELGTQTPSTGEQKRMLAREGNPQSRIDTQHERTTVTTESRQTVSGAQEAKTQIRARNPQTPIDTEQASAQVLGGRIHTHSAAGLLHIDFRMPTLDYVALISLTRHLTQSPAASKTMFDRAIFNLFATNQDDHAKNWSFLQADDGTWSIAPFYDVTYSPHPFNQHTTAYRGFGNSPSKQALQEMASKASYSWPEALQRIREIAEVVAGFKQVAAEFEIPKEIIRRIDKDIRTRREENAAFL